MKHIDVTIDLETLALSSDAAIVQMVAVPWDRNATDSPFIDNMVFSGHVDIRSCIMDGFKIEEDTVEWWSKQKNEVKREVFYGENWPLLDVLTSFSEWLSALKHDTGAESLCLWAQGSDFDISILRTAFAHYDVKFPIGRNYFRDARTFILECGIYSDVSNDPTACLQDVSLVYKYLDPMPGDNHQTHNAEYDARRTTWNVWTVLRRLQTMALARREEQLS